MTSWASSSRRSKLTQGRQSEARDIEVGLSTPLGEGEHGKLVVPHGAFADAAKEYLLRVLRNLDSRDFDVEIMRQPWSTSLRVEDGAGGW